MSPEEFFYTGLTHATPPPEFEAYVSGRWCAVSEWIWRSWTGPRRLNGKDYLGDVFFLGSDKVARVR